MRDKFKEFLSTLELLGFVEFLERDPDLVRGNILGHSFGLVKVTEYHTELRIITKDGIKVFSEVEDFKNWYSLNKPTSKENSIRFPSLPKDLQEALINISPETTLQELMDLVEDVNECYPYQTIKFTLFGDGSGDISDNEDSTIFNLDRTKLYE